MNCSTPGPPVHHQLLEFTQTRPSSQWCHPAISSSVIPFSSCPHSLPASESSNESTLRMRWPKYWSFSFSIIPSKEIPGLISFRMDWLDILADQGTLKSLLQHHSSKASILRRSAFFTVQLSHPYMTTGKIIALTNMTHYRLFENLKQCIFISYFLITQGDVDRPNFFPYCIVNILSKITLIFIPLFIHLLIELICLKNMYCVPIKHQLHLIYWEYRNDCITLLIYKELITLQLFIKNFPFLGERGTHLFIWFYFTNHTSYHLIFPGTFPFRWYIYSKEHKPMFASLTAKERLTNGIDAWLE